MMKKLNFYLLVLYLSIIPFHTNAQWEQILADTNVKEVFVSDTNIFIGTDDGKIYLSSDLGQNWTNLKNNLPDYVIDNIGISDSNKLVCTCGRYVFVSTDWSEWTQVYQLVDKATCMAIDGASIFVGGEFSGGIHASYDNGNNWSNLSENLPNKYLTSVAVQDTTILVSTFGGGKLYITNDNGITWDIHNQGTSGNIFSLTNYNGFYAGGENKIYKLDGGTIWIPIYNTGQILDFAYKQSYFTACGGSDSASLYLSIDSGITWETIQATYTSGQFRAIDIYDNSVFAGNNDGLYKYNLPPVYIPDPSAKNKIREIKFHIYPNPAENQIAIEISRLSSNSMSLEIFDEAGRVVKTSKISDKKSMISIDDLRPGIYYCKVGDDRNFSVEKFIKH